MRIGVHLPLIDFGEGAATGAQLRDYTRAAADLGFTTLSVNDHLVWRRPWIDGPTALATVASEAGGMRLATTVALPVVRHPVVLAKTLATLAGLSGRPLVAGLGPGSTVDDFHAVGVPFEERWQRFDEAFRLVRALLRGEPAPAGPCYDVGPTRLEPLPTPAPQVWFGSWGSDTRLRRAAAAADGWMASAYNLSPEDFAGARARLDDHLVAVGRDPAAVPDLVATAWCFVSDDAAAVREVMEGVLAPTLRRDPDELQRQLPVGSTEHAAGVLARYAAAGAQEVLLWPVRHPLAQLEVVAAEVVPEVPTA